MMNWKGCGRKWSWPNVRCCTGICLEGLKKKTKTLNQNSWYSGRDLNLGPPEYEAWVNYPNTTFGIIYYYYHHHHHQ
jgi:hypothetical protein